MYHYWKQNRNVIFAAIGLFLLSLTGMLFFLNEDAGHKGDLHASVVDSSAQHGEQQGSEEEQKYREELKLKEEPFLILNLDGTVRLVSVNYATATGYAPEEIQEKLLFSLIHQGDLSRVIAAFGKVIAQESPVTMVGPYRMQSNNGEYRLNMASFYPLMNHKKLESIGVVVLDITGDVGEQPQEPQPQEPKKSEKPEKQNETEDQHKPNHGPHIRDEKNESDKRLVVEKLEQ